MLQPDEKSLHTASLKTTLLESSQTTCTVCRHAAHCESLYCSKPIRNKSAICTNCNHPHHESYNAHNVCDIFVPTSEGGTKPCNCAVCSCQKCQPLTRCGCNHCYCDVRCLPVHRHQCSKNIKFFAFLSIILIIVAFVGFLVTCVPTVALLASSESKRSAAVWVGIAITGIVFIAYGVPTFILGCCAIKNVKNYYKPRFIALPHHLMMPVGKDEFIDDDEIHLKTEADELSEVHHNNAEYLKGSGSKKGANIAASIKQQQFLQQQPFDGELDQEDVVHHQQQQQQQQQQEQKPKIEEQVPIFMVGEQQQ